MQERVNEKTVAVAVQATKMSGRMIARIGEMYLRHVRENAGITSLQRAEIRQPISITGPVRSR